MILILAGKMRAHCQSLRTHLIGSIEGIKMSTNMGRSPIRMPLNDSLRQYRRLISLHEGPTRSSQLTAYSPTSARTHLQQRSLEQRKRIPTCAQVTSTIVTLGAKMQRPKPCAELWTSDPWWHGRPFWESRRFRSNNRACLWMLMELNTWDLIPKFAIRPREHGCQKQPLTCVLLPWMPRGNQTAFDARARLERYNQVWASPPTLPKFYFGMRWLWCGKRGRQKGR